jgi:hypothetical protein
MSRLQDALADVRRSAGAAGCLFINPPASASPALLDQATRALAVLERRSRLPRLAVLDAEALARAADLADLAAGRLAAIAWASTDAGDRAVILAPAFDLVRAADAARAALAPADAGLAARADRSAGIAAAALVKAREAAGC